MKHALVNEERGVTIVEVSVNALMDPLDMERFKSDLNQLVETQDKRRLILDLARVQFLASQAIGTLVTMHRATAARPKGGMVIVGVGPRIAELLRITRLDKVFTVRASRQEAMKHFARHGMVS